MSIKTYFSGVIFVISLTGMPVFAEDTDNSKGTIIRASPSSLSGEAVVDNEEELTRENTVREATLVLKQRTGTEVKLKISSRHRIGF